MRWVTDMFITATKSGFTLSHCQQLIKVIKMIWSDNYPLQFLRVYPVTALETRENMRGFWHHAKRETKATLKADRFCCLFMYLFIYVKILPRLQFIQSSSPRMPARLSWEAGRGRDFEKNGLDFAAPSGNDPELHSLITVYRALLGKAGNAFVCISCQFWSVMWGDRGDGVVLKWPQALKDFISPAPQHLSTDDAAYREDTETVTTKPLSVWQERQQLCWKERKQLVCVFLGGNSGEGEMVLDTLQAKQSSGKNHPKK